MLNLGLRSSNRRARDDQYSWQQWPGVIVSGARGCNDGDTGLNGYLRRDHTHFRGIPGGK
jgi:hypothetical protein